MTRAAPPIHIDERSEARFSHRQHMEILERQSDEHGIAHCKCCGEPIAKLKPNSWVKLRDFAFDHIKERALGGETIVENGQAICDGPKTCHGVKTSEFAPVLAKCKRLSGEFSNQHIRRKERPRPLIPSRPMRSTKDFR